MAVTISNLSFSLDAGMWSAELLELELCVKLKLGGMIMSIVSYLLAFLLTCLAGL